MAKKQAPANVKGRQAGAREAGAAPCPPQRPRERFVRDSAKHVRELVDVSHWAGRRPDLVQAGGGNTSVKSADGKTMYLKASGYGLSDLLPLGVPGGPRGYVAMSLPRVLSLLDREDLDGGEGVEARLRDAFTACCTYRPAPEVRPSVEALLHALVGRVAVHSHPPAVVALVSSRDTKDAVGRFARTLGEDVLFLPYLDPGLERARDLRDALARAHVRGENRSVLLMENHGLFVSGESAAQVRRLTNRCLAVAARLVRRSPRPAPRRAVTRPRGTVLQLLPLVRGALWRATGSRFFVRFETSAELSALARTGAGRRALVAGPLSPDEVVYCQSQPLVLAGDARSGDEETLRRKFTRATTDYVRRHKVAPRVVLLGGGEYLVLGESERSLAWTSETARAAFQAKLAALALGGPRPLSRWGAAFIEHWEAEAYRRGLAGRGGSGLPLATRVAVVTGAGSGLGRGIALGLARAGASVVLADTDREAALATRAEILRETPRPPAGGHPGVLALRADVTRERAVARLFEETVRAFGGVDILVNAAGIAPSHPLVDFPLAEWERALRLNLTGYFLVAREAARWMLRQAGARVPSREGWAPDAGGGSIINLSSKTGLEASVDNSAYNATKAAEIHLARGWALELAPFGVRVNALAPGNVFAGSKIWNRKYIEACARKRGIRPEDVIPYYVNLTALKTEIQPQDVADAVVFLVSDRARVITGQTLVPDAGQVFVR